MRRFVAIGGGEMRAQSSINRFIVDLIDRSALVERTKPYAVFLPQASHESKPYTNTFFKTFSRLKCKADVILFAQGEMDRERIATKLSKADIIYIGGGDARYLLDELERMGIGDMLLEAYDRGAVIAGNSAGAMCMYESAISDYLIARGESDQYTLIEGLGAQRGLAVCHADEESRCAMAEDIDIPNKVFIPTNTAVYYENGEMIERIEEIIED